MTPPWLNCFNSISYFSRSCRKAAKRGSSSFSQEQGPSFRLWPQRQHIPLQSSLHKSLESIFRTNTVRTISPKSALSSTKGNTHSSSFSSFASSMISIASVIVFSALSKAETLFVKLATSLDICWDFARSVYISGSSKRRSFSLSSFLNESKSKRVSRFQKDTF